MSDLQTVCSTYWAKIYVGTKTDDPDHVWFAGDLYEILQKYVDDVGLCVTLDTTQFIYRGGHEYGFVVGLIQYPRFPRGHDNIRTLALDLASKPKDLFQQKRVSVVFPEETVMLGNLDD